MAKTYCDGSGSAPAERKHQPWTNDWLGKCGRCDRILKPVPESGLLRRHSVRGKNTASHDKTMENLWAYADTESPGQRQQSLRRAIQEIVDEQGWDDNTILGLALDFIARTEQSVEQFVAQLKDIQQEENSQSLDWDAPVSSNRNGA